MTPGLAAGFALFLLLAASAWLACSGFNRSCHRLRQASSASRAACGGGFDIGMSAAPATESQFKNGGV